MKRGIYIGKSLLKRILAGEPTDEIACIDIEEGFFILDKTEGCIELGAPPRVIPT